MRLRGVEPPRPVRVTRPSTLRVYQFRHRRVLGQSSGRLTSEPLAERRIVRVRTLVETVRGGRYSPEHVFDQAKSPRGARV